MAELQMLLDQEIPNGRQALLDSHNNLKKVASYCAQKYVNEPNKKVALDETKQFTTQSLASVAYQINTLANNMLHMLDIQAIQLASMDSAIHNIAQTVDVHKEKVARREIGLLTTNKVVAKTHQVVAPQNPDRPTKYVRKPIDYAELDDVGHGVKLNSQSSTGTARRPSGQASRKSTSASADGSSKRDSLKSNTSAFGTLRAVKAPTVPQEFNQTNNRRLPSMFHTRANSNSSTESGSHSSATALPAGLGVPPPPPAVTDPGIPAPPAAPGNTPPPPPLDGNSLPPPPPPAMSPQMAAPPPPAPPIAPTLPNANSGYSTPHVGFNGKPALAGGSAENYAATSVMDLPPPPPPQFSSSSLPMGATGRSPNLPTTGFASRVGGTGMGIPPPPPPLAMGGADVLPPPPPSLGFDDIPPMPEVSMEPDWAPSTYLEKMVVIYDYSAANSDELSLKEDQVVYVVKKNDDGWYEGVLNGVNGLFPGNYAEPVSS